MMMSQKTSSGSEVLNELGDKLMARLATSESNLLLLGVIQSLFRKSKLKISKRFLDLWPKMIEWVKIFNFCYEICRQISRANYKIEFRNLLIVS